MEPRASAEGPRIVAAETATPFTVPAKLTLPLGAEAVPVKNGWHAPANGWITGEAAHPFGEDQRLWSWRNFAAPPTEPPAHETITVTR